MATFFVTGYCINQRKSASSLGSWLAMSLRVISIFTTACFWQAFAFDASAGENIRWSSVQQPSRQLDSRQIGEAVGPSIEQLIEQLGDASYIVRDEAEKRLLKIGGPAIKPLRMASTYRGTGQPDSEIRLRATRLLILIERKERQRKIREFLEGDQNDLNLAGWSEFSRIVGSDRVSRQLFVDMHQAQPELLATLTKDKKTLEESYQSVSKRSLRFNNYSNATQTIGTLTAMLFVSTLEFPSQRNQGRERISVGDVDLRRMTTALTQTQMVTFVNSSGTKNQLGKLISYWLGTLPDNENVPVIAQLSVIDAYQLKKQADQVALFANNRELPPPTRITAIDIFGRLANQDDVEKLEPLLDDQTVVGNYLPRTGNARAKGINDRIPSFEPVRPKLMQVQIRDLVLAQAIKLSGQNPAEFGFNPKCFSKEMLIRNYAGFFSEEDRKTAFDNWATRNEFD